MFIRNLLIFIYKNYRREELYNYKKNLYNFFFLFEDKNKTISCIFFFLNIYLGKTKKKLQENRMK